MALQILYGRVESRKRVGVQFLRDEGRMVIGGRDDLARVFDRFKAEHNLDGLNAVIKPFEFLGFFFGIRLEPFRNIGVATGDGNPHDFLLANESDKRRATRLPKCRM